MKEVKKIGDRTFYLSGDYKVGIYVMTEGYTSDKYPERTPVCLIDSGVEESDAASVDAFLEANNYYVHMVINTHYHADHCGGNKYFLDKYNAILTSTKPNACLMSNYDICPSIVWGASPINEIMNKFFYTDSCDTVDIEKVELPCGISYSELKGHSLSMIVVKTSDDVFFLGDALVSKETIDSHSLTYIYDIEKYLDSLDILETLKAQVYIPYHAEPTSDLVRLVKLNRRKVLESIDLVLDICESPTSTEDIVAEFFKRTGASMGINKYVVESSVVKSYISYLHNIQKLDIIMEDNRLKWSRR